ncbi:Prefoldin subunit 4 [Grifola frondosa]|uniref:Prefoldin subunit 4 n=1 Tax=Grifola frondosa TaxID=5627 RepID=A0A1C7M663_GRIFR|nr:Prefoldin subunit 4 [Grifola frondosa]
MRMACPASYFLAQEDEHDDTAEVTWEDQQRINSFSKLNTRLKSIEDEIEGLKQEKEALDDLSMELELGEEDQPVIRAMKRLEKDHAKLNDELSRLTARAQECEKSMKELKVILYAKFGRAINLDE